MRIRRFSFVLLAAAFAASMLVAPAAAGSHGPGKQTIESSSRQHATHPTQSNGVDMGTLRIPSIGLDENVRSGVAQAVINSGVAHWVGTADPGEAGNVVLAGHRTTYTRPFYDLDRLEVGDLVYMTDGSGFEVMYRVSDTFIVTPKDVWITYDQGTPMLTMFACHPKGSKRFRIVVQAELVGRRRVA
jgi:LPXTG-site transpeptidase (sortase) family protein